PPPRSPLFPYTTLFRSWDGLPRRSTVWMSHGDLVRSAPPGFTVTGRTANTEVAAMADPQRRLYGVQFHPEVVHTVHGGDLLQRLDRKSTRLNSSHVKIS